LLRVTVHDSVLVHHDGLARVEQAVDEVLVFGRPAALIGDEDTDVLQVGVLLTADLVTVHVRLHGEGVDDVSLPCVKALRAILSVPDSRRATRARTTPRRSQGRALLPI